jgi:hypothetical protein
MLTKGKFLHSQLGKGALIFLSGRREGNIKVL